MELANVGIVADLAIAADDGRADDHHAVLQHGALADGNALANICGALAAIEQLRARAGGQVGGDFGQRLPGEFAALEERGMFRLGQVKEFTRLEHSGGRVRSRPPPAKFKKQDVFHSFFYFFLVQLSAINLNQAQSASSLPTLKGAPARPG
jgi:hypothetical protein